MCRCRGALLAALFAAMSAIAGHEPQVSPSYGRLPLIFERNQRVCGIPNLTTFETRTCRGDGCTLGAAPHCLRRQQCARHPR